MQNNLSPLGRALDSIALLSMIGLLFAFIFGMPWLDFGLWPETEGPMAYIHVLVAVISICGGLQLGLGNSNYIASAKSPIVISLFLFAIFSVALLPFIDTPLKSLHGTLKHGVGVLWYLELSICVYVMLALWQRPFVRYVISLASMMVAVIIFILYLVPQNPFGLPLNFAEWVGMLALAVSGIVILANRDSQYRWAYFILAAVITVVGYYISENRAVILAIAIMSLFWLLKFVPGLNLFYLNPAGRSISVATLVLAGVVAMYLSAPLIERNSMINLKSDTELLSNLEIDQLNLHESTFGTIWSRSYMIRILKNNFEEHPRTLLTGNGFGSFAAIYENHVDEVPGRRFRAPVNTASNTYWDVHEKANFHSHNVIAENIASVGVVGAALWMIVLIALAYTSPAGAIVSVGFAVVSTFWFPLNHMIGVIAILFAASAWKPIQGKLKSPVLSGLSPVITILMTALLGYSGYMSGTLARTERLERGFSPLMTNSDIQTCGFLRANYFQESEVVIDLYGILVKRIINSDNQAQEVFDRTTNLVTTNCMLRRYFEYEGNMRALVASLEGREALVNLGSFAFPAMAKEIVNWSSDIQLLLMHIPERTEFIPPFIETLLKNRPEIASKSISELLPLLNEGDPVREYTLAMQALINKDNDGYKRHMQSAVDLGYANLRFISPQTAKLIGVE